MSVSRDFDMLGKISTGKKVKKLDCLSIAEVVDMYISCTNSICSVTLANCAKNELLTLQNQFVKFK